MAVTHRAVSSVVVAGLLASRILLAQGPGDARAPAISAEFPYESRYVEVLGSRMHYVEEGAGDPVLFIHGNPTSSYLWRNVIPHISGDHRAIAVDLIGMGKSDKPDIDYTYVDHSRYVQGFIERLGLEHVTLVIHDWGTVLGFEYAMTHEDNVAGIAFMEAIVPPAYPRSEPMAGQFASFRTEGEGEALVLEQNIFLEQILPGAVVRGLTEEEMRRYREPYPTPASRRPVLQWPRELPAGGEPRSTVAIVNRIGDWMQQTEIPMLHLWARPGTLNNEDFAEAMVERVKNLQSTFIGEGRHYIQEDQPDAIGRALAGWLATMGSSVGATATNGDADLPTAEIISRAVMRARIQDESGAELQFDTRIFSINHSLDENYEVESTETLLTRGYALEGLLYEEVIEKDGMPLNEKDAREEQERREEFVEEVRERARKGEDYDTEDERTVRFDEDLIARYEVTRVGVEAVNGEPCWVIAFRPRPGKLPERSRMDKALNRSTGRLWVAQSDYGVARIEFEMGEPVRWLWGLAATLRRAAGRLEFERAEGDVWIPKAFDLTIDVRVFFRSVRRHILREWVERVYNPL